MEDRGPLSQVEEEPVEPRGPRGSYAQEVFQILAEKTELGGELKIRWDNFEFKIPITVGTAI